MSWGPLSVTALCNCLVTSMPSPWSFDYFGDSNKNDLDGNDNPFHLGLAALVGTDTWSNETFADDPQIAWTDSSFLVLCNLMSYDATSNFANDMNAFVSNVSVSEHCLAQCFVPMARY